MSHMWVSHPGTRPPTSPKLLQSINEQQLLFDEIDKLGSMSCCRICGVITKLSKEHAPAKAAFNKTRLFAFSIKEKIVNNFLQWSRTIQQGGSYQVSLCEECNNNTGSWYNPEYVRFVKACAPFALEANANKIIELDVNIHPARVVKQALIHILSTSPPGVGSKFENLKEAVLVRNSAPSINPIKIGLFLRVNNGGRHSGVTIFVNIEKEKAKLIDEFSFWPVGWIITFDDLPFEGVYDVSSWLSFAWDKKVKMRLSVPCHWCVSPYPGDFRGPTEVSGKYQRT